MDGKFNAGFIFGSSMGSANKIRPANLVVCLFVLFILVVPGAYSQQPVPPSSRGEIKNLLRDLEVLRIQIENLRNQEKALVKMLEDAKAEIEKSKRQYIEVKMRGELHSTPVGTVIKLTVWSLRVQGRSWKLDLRKWKKPKSPKKLLADGRAVVVHGYLVDRRRPDIGGLDGFPGTTRDTVVVVEKVEPVAKTPKKVP